MSTAFAVAAWVAYVAVWLIATRYVYVFQVDSGDDDHPDVRLVSLAIGAVWPVLLVVLSGKFLVDRTLFRPTAAQRRRQAEVAAETDRIEAQKTASRRKADS